MKRPEHIIEDLITRQLDGTPSPTRNAGNCRSGSKHPKPTATPFSGLTKPGETARLAETRFNTGQALENVMARIAEASRPRSFLRPQLRRLGIGIAAAACVMLAVVGYYRLQPSTVPDIEMFIRQADTPVFTQKEVQLVLSEQKTLLLETQKSTIRYDSTAIRINNAEKTIPKKEAATFNQLVVPYGKQTTLTLADGTRVWINAGHGWSTRRIRKAEARNIRRRRNLHGSGARCRTAFLGTHRQDGCLRFGNQILHILLRAAIARRRSSCSPAPSA